MTRSLVEKRQVFDGSRTGYGVSCIGMTVEKGLVFIETAKKSIEDLVGCHGGGKRQISPGYTFGKTDKIGFHHFLLACEHGSRPAETGCYFICYKVKPVVFRDPPYPVQEAVRLHDHPRRPLDQGLDNNRTDLVLDAFSRSLRTGDTGHIAGPVRQLERAPVTIG